MKTLREIRQINNAVQFVTDKMNFSSVFGRKTMLDQKFMTKKEAILLELNKLNAILEILKKEESISNIAKFEAKLHQINDIKNTINRLSKAQTLDDVELFEIKKFALICIELNEVIDTFNLDFVKWNDLTAVADILDPEKKRIPHFYIYSDYDDDLFKIRDEIDKSDDETVRENLLLKSEKIEQEVRQMLSSKLADYHLFISQNISTISELDFIFAKAKLAIELNFSEPQYSNETIEYIEIFHPMVKEALQSEGRDFQNLSLELYTAPCLVTGVNMGGKSVMLKTIVLIQYLFQFGFYVPAQKAKLRIFKEIYFNSGDTQSDVGGLSSFASEMLIVNDIISAAKRGRRIMVVLDELARTTNPDEGGAILSAVLEILDNYNVVSVITTHYGQIKWDGHRLRVKGLRKPAENEEINVKNIGNFMDYSLVPEDKSHSYMQALDIAKVLGVDGELLSKANKYLNNPNTD